MQQTKMRRAKLFCGVAVALLIGVLCLPETALAQPCACGARVVAPSYGASTHNAPYVAPLVGAHHAPVYQQTFGVKEIFYIPTATPVTTNLDYSFTVRDDSGDAAREERLVNKVAERVAGLLALQQRTAPPANNSGASIPASSVPLTAPTLGAKKGVAANHVPSAFTTRIFAERCNRCHGDAGIVRGGLNLLTPQMLTVEDWAACYAQCVAGDMPKDDKPLTNDETRALYDDYKAALGKRK